MDGTVKNLVLDEQVKNCDPAHPPARIAVAIAPAGRGRFPMPLLTSAATATLPTSTAVTTSPPSVLDSSVHKADRYGRESQETCRLLVMARPRKFDEQQVLDIARDLFWSGGFAATRMEDLAAATGLGKGSLYGAFGGKQELFRRVFDDYCASVVDATGQQLRGDDKDAYARLSAHVHFVAAATAADTVHRGCLLAKGAAELAEHDKTVAKRAHATIEALRTLLEDDIAACQRNGDIAANVDPEKLAALVLAVLRGIEALGKAGADTETLTDIAQTALAVLPRSVN